MINSKDYQVGVIDLACASEDGYDSIIVQPQSNTFLLDMRDGAYFRLQRFKPS